MADIASLTEYISDSIYTPMLETDPAYIKLQGRVESIIIQNVKVTGYTVETLPENYEYFVSLLVLKYMFRVLAVSKAPEYDMEAEFTTLSKGDRFDHYSKLIEEINKEIEMLISNGIVSIVSDSNTVSSHNVTLDTRDGTVRNYLLSQSQTASITFSAITSNSVDIDWSTFNQEIARFNGYEFYFSTQVLFDPYVDDTVDKNLADIYKVFNNPKKTKYRVTNLLPETTYYVVVSYRAMNMNVDYFTASFTTLAEEVPPEGEG